MLVYKSIISSRFRLFFLCAIFLSFIALGHYFLGLYQNKTLLSPVLGSETEKFSDNVWYPQDIKSDFDDAPKITATAGFFIDFDTGEVLYEKNSDKKYSVASLVKMMTAIIALENSSWEKEMLVSKRASETEPDKMNLAPGEKLTLKELLEGVFLISANDAAEVLSENILLSREEFIEAMNQKGKLLGMANSLFLNPSGLEEDSPQYSTAFDVLLMSRHAIKNWPALLNITSNPHIFIPATDSHQDYDLYSGINLVTTYPGVIGFKTGYTPKAGLTLVTIAEREGKVVLGVLLGSTDRRDDAKVLLDYSFSKLGVDTSF